MCVPAVVDRPPSRSRRRHVPSGVEGDAHVGVLNAGVQLRAVDVRVAPAQGVQKVCQRGVW